MTEYEKWSLALTAIGHLFVASSIFYAARQWLIAQKSHERTIIKDTRDFISDISERVHLYQQKIIENNTDPASIDLRSEESVPIKKLLNTLEAASYELQTGFYDADILNQYLDAQAKYAISKFKSYIQKVRYEYGSPDLYIELEKVASRYNK